MLDYIEWEDCIRVDADGDDVGLLVRVYFKAESWVPLSPQTWDSPVEGWMFEDINFVRVEIDSRSLPCEPLTDAEIAAARAWFDTHEVQCRANDSAVRLLESQH